MKTETYVQMVLDQGGELLKGFNSGADNEKWAQVIIDQAFKTRWGVSLSHWSMGGIKLRETPYPGSINKGLFSDAGFLYSRPNPANDQLTKTTGYFVELKTETGSTKGRFSGMSWRAAFTSDIEKLQNVSGHLGLRVISGEAQRYRCFATLISFFPDTSAKIISDHATYFPGSVCNSAIVDNCTVCVLAQDVGFKI